MSTASYYMKKIEDIENDLFSIVHPGMTADFFKFIEYNKLNELKGLVVEMREYYDSILQKKG